jgi:predicted transposase YbfD/YdcC
VEQIPEETNKVELSVAPQVLAQIPVRGNIITGDALYCQGEVCSLIVEGEGDYLFIVKGNQPDLLEAIEYLFQAPPFGEKFAYTKQCDAHADRIETRRLWASSSLQEYLHSEFEWPGAERGQVLKVEREMERVIGGKVVEHSIEVRYAITSLSAKVGAKRLLELVRGHWGIENRLHYVRDVTMGEDASRIRSGSAPEVMAALRNVVIALLRAAGFQNMAAALREIAWLGGALAFLCLSPG